MRQNSIYVNFNVIFIEGFFYDFSVNEHEVQMFEKSSYHFSLLLVISEPFVPEQ